MDTPTTKDQRQGLFTKLTIGLKRSKKITVNPEPYDFGEVKGRLYLRIDQSLLFDCLSQIKKPHGEMALQNAT
jgi:hypothetical protein